MMKGSSGREGECFESCTWHPACRTVVPPRCRQSDVGWRRGWQGQLNGAAGAWLAPAQRVKAVISQFMVQVPMTSSMLCKHPGRAGSSTEY